MSSGASGALLIFTGKSTLSYTHVLGCQKKNKQEDPDQTPLYATSDQDLHGLGIDFSNLGPTKMQTVMNKKKKTKTEEENRCVQDHSQLGLK